MATETGASGEVEAALEDDPTCRQSTVLVVRAGGEQRIPVARVDRRHLQGGRVLREGHGVAPLGGQAPDLLGRLLHVEEREDAAGDEPVGVGGAPLVDVPVVVRLDHDLVEARSGPSLSTWPENPVQLGKLRPASVPAGRHVPHPLVDVEAARAHLRVHRRVDVVHLAGLARHGVEAEVAPLLVPVPPLLEALGVGLHPGGSVPVLGRNVALEHVRRLGNVVVDTDQDHVVGLHVRVTPLHSGKAHVSLCDTPY